MQIGSGDPDSPRSLITWQAPKKQHGIRAILTDFGEARVTGSSPSNPAVPQCRYPLCLHSQPPGPFPWNAAHPDFAKKGVKQGRWSVEHIDRDCVSFSVHESEGVALGTMGVVLRRLRNGWPGSTQASKATTVLVLCGNGVIGLTRAEQTTQQLSKGTLDGHCLIRSDQGRSSRLMFEQQGGRPDGGGETERKLAHTPESALSSFPHTIGGGTLYVRMHANPMGWSRLSQRKQEGRDCAPNYTKILWVWCCSSNPLLEGGRAKWNSCCRGWCCAIMRDWLCIGLNKHLCCSAGQAQRGN